MQTGQVSFAAQLQLEVITVELNYNLQLPFLKKKSIFVTCINSIKLYFVSELRENHLTLSHKSLDSR